MSRGTVHSLGMCARNNSLDVRRVWCVSGVPQGAPVPAAGGTVEQHSDLGGRHHPEEHQGLPVPQELQVLQAESHRHPESHPRTPGQVETGADKWCMRNAAGNFQWTKLLKFVLYSCRCNNNNNDDEDEDDDDHYHHFISRVIIKSYGTRVK